MRNIFIAFFLLALLSLAPNSFVSKVEAGCACRYQPGYPVPAVGGVQVGYLEYINDGGNTCEELYGKKGLDQGSYSKIVAKATDEYGCDVNKGTLDVGWQIPTFSQLIGNIIRLIFFIAGLFALVFLLLGGFEWVQSGGEEKKIEAARGKITASVIGLVVMIAVLSLVIFLEQVVFGSKICLGISCPMNIGFLQLIR